MDCATIHDLGRDSNVFHHSDVHPQHTMGDSSHWIRILPKSALHSGHVVRRRMLGPLGTTESVVRALKQLGVPVQDDVRLRTLNRYHIESTHVY